MAHQLRWLNRLSRALRRALIAGNGKVADSLAEAIDWWTLRIWGE